MGARAGNGFVLLMFFSGGGVVSLKLKDLGAGVWVLVPSIMSCAGIRGVPVVFLEEVDCFM